ncbi:MAG: ABC transporter ATP-binding protein [Actinomycetaceae bacterium]|nr:ABC transporter ATP-binding protein [Actinomycetaceae bacterium]MDY6083436.1 ABC transporter ATP-binding protein [Actinomycetaceae bacterium]
MFQHLQFSWSVSPSLNIFLFLALPATPFLSWLTIRATGMLVATIGSPHEYPDTTWTSALVVFIAVSLTSALLASLVTYALEILNMRSIVRLQQLIALATLIPNAPRHHSDSAQDGAAIDDGIIASAFSQSRDYMARSGIQALWSIYFARAAAVGAFIVVAQWNVLCAVILVVVFYTVGRIHGSYLEHTYAHLYGENDNARRAEYFRSLSFTRSGAAELRVFGLAPWLLRGFRVHREASHARTTLTRRSQFFQMLAIASGLALCVIVVVFLMSRELHDGALTSAQFVMLVESLVGFVAFGPIDDFSDIVARQRAQLKTLYPLYQVNDLNPFSRHDVASLLRNVNANEDIDHHIERRNQYEEHSDIVVDVDSLSFTYPESKTKALDSVSFRVHQGERVALVGKNGSGKSTLLNVIAGRIHSTDKVSSPCTIDGLISLIPQQFPRYELSLRENIVPADDTHTIELSLLSDAAAQTSLNEIISEDNFTTILNSAYEHGRDLSSGQWQRVALARMIADIAIQSKQDPGTPPIVLLDEPTSTLDVRTEKEIFEAFFSVSEGWTSIVATHRLGSIKDVDRIIVLDHGRIVEEGSHAKLMAADGLYADLYRAQAELVTGNPVISHDESATHES